MRVLVVEDDPALGGVLQRGLREEGHAVDLEASVAGADAALDLSEYDLLVVDVGLPDGNGLSLCERVREERRPTRVLVVTARDTLSDKVGGLDTGADDYLTKPFDFPELTARTRALLRRPATETQPVYEVGDIRLDPASHRVWRGAVLIPLTAKEFGLLHYLMARPGDVVSRTDILEHVWDAYYDGLSNVVDVQIVSLRRKLDQPDSPAPIETVRGVGYRLNP